MFAISWIIALFFHAYPGAPRLVFVIICSPPEWIGTVDVEQLNGFAVVGFQAPFQGLEL